MKTTGLAMLIVGLTASTTLPAAEIVDGPAAVGYGIADDSNGAHATLQVAGSDLELADSWWWYRLADEWAESALPAPDSAARVGNSTAFFWPEVGRESLSADLVDTVSSDAGAATLRRRLTIRNPSDSPLVLDLFHALALDGGRSGAAVSASRGNRRGEITISTPAGSVGEIWAAGADQLQVAPLDGALSGLARALDDGLRNDLDGTGLPFGPGRLSAAFQWRQIEIPAGGQHRFTVVVALNQGANDFELAWRSQDPGGHHGPVDGLELVSTIGQPDAATWSGDAFVLQGGFLPAFIAEAFDGIFADGFESGDTTVWTTTLP